MKLMRVGPPGAEKPAMMAPDGTIRDLSGTVGDFDAAALSPQGLARLAALDPASLPRAAEGRVGPCVPRPVNFICIGLNYADHAAEGGMPIPKEPIIFLKSLGAYQGPQRRHPHPARRHQDRLGGGAGDRHRHQGQLGPREPGDGARGRLLRGERRERARVPA